jgi:hypothetical protein
LLFAWVQVRTPRSWPSARLREAYVSLEHYGQGMNFNPLGIGDVTSIAVAVIALASLGLV